MKGNSDMITKYLVLEGEEVREGEFSEAVEQNTELFTKIVNIAKNDRVSIRTMFLAMSIDAPFLFETTVTGMTPYPISVKHSTYAQAEEEHTKLCADVQNYYMKQRMLHIYSELDKLHPVYTEEGENVMVRLCMEPNFLGVIPKVSEAASDYLLTNTKVKRKHLAITEEFEDIQGELHTYTRVDWEFIYDMSPDMYMEVKTVAKEAEVETKTQVQKPAFVDPFVGMFDSVLGDLLNK